MSKPLIIRATAVRRLAATAAALAIGVIGTIAEIATDPVGVLVLPLKGGSDTHVSVPLTRPVELTSSVKAVSGNVVSLNLASNLSASRFAYVEGSQPKTYYLQFTSGAKAGSYFTITGNDAASVTLDLLGDNLTGVVAGDIVKVIPYWTLDTLFPGGQGIHLSPGISPTSTIILPRLDAAGINLSANEIYYYYGGASFNGPGWRRAGQELTKKFPDAVLLPDSFFIVRNGTGTADTQLTVAGNVPMSKQTIPVSNLAPNTPQDNAVALPVPVDVTLEQSGLYPNVMAGSTSLVPADSLIVFDPALQRINKSATSIYYYYAGASFGGPGWRRAGDISTIRNNEIVFKAGRGYVIRRGARPQAETVLWQFVPAYL